MRLGKMLYSLALLAALSLQAGCGVFTSDEERIARAEQEMAEGNYRAAMIELRNVLGNDGSNRAARLMLAEVTLGLGDVETAEKELQRAAELGASEAEVQPLHYAILAAQGRYSDMLAGLGLESGGLTADERYRFRGQALIGLGNAAAAATVFETWLAESPDAPEAQIGLANVAAMQGDVAAGAQSLENLLGRDPRQIDGWYALGAMRLQLGQFDAAIDALTTALDLSRPQTNVFRHIALLSELGGAQLAVEDLEAARLTIERLRGIAPQSPSGLMLSARLARAEGDYALAARELQTLLGHYPNNVGAQLYLANVQMLLGNLAQAENLLTRIVATSPANLPARKLLAQVQLRQARPQGAVEALAPLVDSGAGGDADMYALLAQADLQQGATESAIERLRNAVLLDESNMGNRMSLAAAYLSAQRPVQAIEVLDEVPGDGDIGLHRERMYLQALALSERRTQARERALSFPERHADKPQAAIVAAEFLDSISEHDAARGLLQSRLGTDGRSPELVNALARVELRSGNPGRAAELYHEVLDADSGDYAALVGLARVAWLEDDVETKIAMLERAVAVEPEAQLPRAWLAQSLLASGRAADAEPVVNEMVVRGFQHPLMSQIAGAVLLEVGRYEEAIRHIEAAVAVQPDSADMQFSLAQAYMNVDRSVEARAALDEALRLQPDWPPALTMLALIELKQGRHDAALETVNRLRRAHPNDASAMVLEGEVHTHRQDYVSAVAAFERAVAAGAGRSAVLRAYMARRDGGMSLSEAPLRTHLDANPDDTVVRSFLAQHYYFEGNSTEAIGEYEKAVQADPDNAAVLNNLAWLYQESGDLDRALQLAEQAWSLDRRSGSIADTLGWIYRDLGQMEKSKQMLNDAGRLAPDNGEIQYHRATVLFETGDVEAARELLTALLSSDAQFPSREAAMRLLEKL